MTTLATYTVALSAAGLVGKEQWVHLLPSGTFDARDGRGPWTLQSPQSVVAASMAHSRGAPIAVDYDHQIDHAPKNGQPAPAAGWISKFEARADGIWGLIEWTALAAERLARREYRFISPVFNYAASGEVMAILRAGLTNAPALSLTALASESTIMDPMQELLQELRQLLGLGASADAMAIVEAVKTLTTTIASAAPSPDKYVPIAAVQSLTAELNRLRKGVSVEAASIIVDTAVSSGKLPPFLKEWGVALCQDNRPAFEKFVGAVGGGMTHLFTDMVPGSTPNTALASMTAVEAAIATNLGHSAADMARTRKADR